MATWIVNTTADDGSVDTSTNTGSLRGIIGAAASGDTIVFDDSLEENGVITIILSSQIIYPAKTLIIDGGETWTDNGVLKTRVVLDAQADETEGNQRRVVSCASNCNVTIYGVTFKGGYLLSSNYGGGLLAESSSTVTINNCVFNNCYAVYGGALYITTTAGQITINNSLFSACTAQYGGGGVYCYNTSPATFNNCVFNNCATTNTSTTSTYGGAVFYFRRTGETNINNCTFINCTSGRYGNILLMRESPTVTLNNCSYSSAEKQDIRFLGTGVLKFAGTCSFSNVYADASTSTTINGSLTVGTLTLGAGASVTFDGVDRILAVTTIYQDSGATYAAATDSTGYLALYVGATVPTVGTGVKTCTYGANIESASVSATAVSWAAETLSTPILIEQLSGDSWNTLTDAATGGTYSGTFGEGVTVRLFDGVAFYYASRQAPYWLVNSFAVNASNGWIVDASAVATNGGGGTDPVTGDPLPYWTITTDDITPNF